MRSHAPPLLALAVLLGAAAAPASPAARAETRWVSLFDGRTLQGWKVPAENPYWRVEKGALVGENDPALKGSMLYTQTEWRDFQLEFEARWDGEIDSGVMFRKPELQLQLGVSRSLKVDMTAAFYTGGAERYPEAGRPKDLDRALRPGRWNRYRLDADGDTFTVFVNGRKVTAYTDPRWPGAGPIGLQVHPGLKMQVAFRKLRIQAKEETVR